MEIVNAIGIVASIAVFIFLASKKINIVLVGMVASLIVIFTSGGNYLELITDTWSGGLSSFIKNYFVIFALSSIYGKLMSDCGAAKKIGLSLFKVCSLSKKHERLLGVLMIPLMYFILIYVGISAWVVIFTVLDISKHLLKRLNIPWRFYTYCVGGSIFMIFPPGSLVLANIQATTLCGVPLTAGALLGFVGLAVAIIVLVIFISADLKKADKNDEGFLPSGKAFEVDQTDIGAADDEKGLPSLLLSILPMATVIIVASAFKVNVIIALAIGILLCVLIMWKRYANIGQTLVAGLVSCFGPVISIAATSAFGSVLRTVPGFTFISSALNVLPALYGGMIFGAVSTFLITTPAAVINVFGPDILAKFTEAGLSADTAARMLAVSTFTGVPPHGSGLANTLMLTKLDYASAVKNYLKVMIAAGVGALACLAMVELGIVH